MTLLQTLALVGVEIQNQNAVIVNLNWGEPAATNTGITLSPIGTSGDRVRYTGEFLPMQELNAFVTGAAMSLAVVEYLRAF